jgi:aryl-alcohol dehydrogenase-like predicted oxidoreductase
MGHTGRKVTHLRGPQDLWYAARGLLRHRADVLAGARLGFLNRLEGFTGPQAALAYVLANPGVACAVIGTSAWRIWRKTSLRPESPFRQR